MLKYFIIFSFIFIGFPAFSLTQKEIDYIHNGGIIIVDKPVKNTNNKAIEATFWINSTPKQIFEVLTDHEKIPEFMPFIVDCKVLDHKGNIFDVYFKAQQMGFNVEYVLRRIYEKYRKISWSKLKGDMKTIEGYWLFTPDPSGKGTISTYFVFVEPGMLVPQEISRYLQKQGLPDMIKSVKKRVESCGVWKKK